MFIRLYNLNSKNVGLLDLIIQQTIIMFTPRVDWTGFWVDQFDRKLTICWIDNTKF